MNNALPNSLLDRPDSGRHPPRRQTGAVAARTCFGPVAQLAEALGSGPRGGGSSPPGVIRPDSTTGRCGGLKPRAVGVRIPLGTFRVRRSIGRIACLRCKRLQVRILPDAFGGASPSCLTGCEGRIATPAGPVRFRGAASAHNFPPVSPRGFGWSAMADKRSAIHAGRVRDRQHTNVATVTAHTRSFGMEAGLGVPAQTHGPGLVDAVSKAFCPGWDSISPCRVSPLGPTPVGGSLLAAFDSLLKSPARHSRARGRLAYQWFGLAGASWASHPDK